MSPDRDSSGTGEKARGGTVRSFVAVPLPADARAAILASVHGAGPGGAPGLSAGLPEIRWSRRPENLHVTLKFLGQVDPALLARFAAALAEALAPTAGFQVSLRGFGAFPSPRDAQVIWVGVDDPARQLAAVAGIVEQVAARLAVGQDHAKTQSQPQAQTPPHKPRPFRAHVTVGRTPRRARHGVDATAALTGWSERAFGPVTISEIHLYESITGGDASTYVLRGTATLHGARETQAVKGATHGDGQDREQGRN
jgi:RNA 2',3'-cyclic 3'-phosphodiesterase